MFFLRNWRDHNLPHMLAEPVAEEIKKTRDIAKVGRRVKKDKNKRGWERATVSLRRQ